jgi:hypothetical protein
MCSISMAYQESGVKRSEKVLWTVAATFGRIFSGKIDIREISDTMAAFRKTL